MKCLLCEKEAKGRSNFCSSEHADTYKGIRDLDVNVIKSKLSEDPVATFKEYLMPSKRRVATRFLSEEFSHLYGGFSFLNNPEYLKYISTISIELPLERKISSFINGEDLSEKFCKTCGKKCVYSPQYRKIKEFCSQACLDAWNSSDEGRERTSNLMKTIMNSEEMKNKIKDSLSKLPQKERSERASNAAKTLWESMTPEKLKELSEKRVQKSLQTLEGRLRGVHGDTYQYPNLDSLTSIDSSRIKIICKKHGMFEQYTFNHMSGQICPKCSAALGTSKAENQLFEFLQNLTGCAEQSNRVVLQGRELDVFVESKNVAVEFDGIYWHSSRSKETDFFHQQRHVEKTEECLEQGIRLFHVFEDEWLNKRLIWESVLTNALRMTPDRIYARLCQVRGISSEDASRFLKDNHLQGSCGSKIKLGLFYQDELVSVMTFGKPRYNKQHDWELLRFCNLVFTNVVGAAGKLFSYFLKNYEGDVVSYANRRWSEGDVYEKLGFSLVSKTEPSYYYSKDGELYHRSSFMKHKLPSLLEDFDPELTEVENMYRNGYSRIWDCGQYTYSFRRC